MAGGPEVFHLGVYVVDVHEELEAGRRTYCDAELGFGPAHVREAQRGIAAFEADELHRMVDLMRDLRASTARRHVREEIPFYTGKRTELGELVANLA